MSSYYRDRERDIDNRSTISIRDREYERDGFTTKKVYRVSGGREEDDRRTVIAGSHRGSDRDRDQTYTETRVIRRTEDREPEPEVERREIRIDRSRERREEPRTYERVVYKEDERLAPYRPFMREEEYDRGQLARYTRETDFYPPPPQPIIIRQEPQQIIIQEAPRAPITVPQPEVRKEEDFQLVQRSEVRESTKSEVGSERPPRSEKPRSRVDDEEDYYYERRVRKVDRDRDDDYEDDRYSRRHERDVSPGSSISQRPRSHGRRYSSEDSYDYVRREEYREGGSVSPHHRRHLAEGAIAGLGAAEILRHHKEKDGGRRSSRHGRVGKDLGAAALGAVGAEAVSRARSHYRSRSRRGSRDRSDSREGRRRRKGSRERERSRSHSRVKKIAELGLGAAAVAAAAAYAKKQSNKKKEERRSRSRRRTGSQGSDVDDARNPSHRNKKIAQAGLAGAAVAGLVERARSKSKGGDRSRSKSRIRQGIPVVAAALGSAGVAALYEKNQAGKKEAEERREHRKTRHSTRDHDRSRSRDGSYEGSREMQPQQQQPPLQQPGGEHPLIEYGNGPMYSNNGIPYDYGRPASQQGYYPNPEAAMVPVGAGPGGQQAAYGAPREQERPYSDSESDSDRRRRRRHHRRHKSDSRSRSRNRDAAAVGGDVAASEYEMKKARKAEKRRERERKREAEQQQYAQPEYQQQPPYASGPGFNAQDPTFNPNQPMYPQPGGAPYAQPEYAAAGAQPGAQIHPDYYQQQGGYVPPEPTAYSPPVGANPYVAPGSGGQRRPDENVSANAPNEPVSTESAPLYNAEGLPFYDPPISTRDGLETSPADTPSAIRSASQPPPHKSVQFDLSSPASPGPADIRRRREQTRANTPAPASLSLSSSQIDHDDDDDGENNNDKARKRERGGRHDRKRERDLARDQARDRDRNRNDTPNPKAKARDPSPTGSDSTEDLPPRFDQDGRRIPERGEDPLADQFEAMLHGQGSMGSGILRNLGLGGGGRDINDAGGRRSDRRSNRRRSR